MPNESRAMLTYDGEAGSISAYLAGPISEEPRPAVIVIHEILGRRFHYGLL
jgi:dienelactone hydrolase